MKKFLIVLILGFLFMQSSAALAANVETRVENISHNFICLCGCNMLLNQCTDMGGCNSQKQLQDIMHKKIASGWSDDKIYNYLLNTYGDLVAAAPPKRGAFNITGWLMPFAVIIIGGFFIFVWIFSLFRRVGYGEALKSIFDFSKIKEAKVRVKEESKEYKEQVDPELAKKLEKELKDFDI